MSRTLSVRKTPAMEAALSEIMRVTDAETTTEAVARALDLYATWLSLKPGTLAEVSAHTRRKTGRKTA
ncbi:hypothetical protein [Streptomyces hirsutus]|uniref:hypothetical protein n=1 Tax=Streptomyces hirsutus TaxID=35620 RepID=UPI0006E1D285|nr:hypothetical protein [Streptomyces hirsutus]